MAQGQSKSEEFSVGGFREAGDGSSESGIAARHVLFRVPPAETINVVGLYYAYIHILYIYICIYICTSYVHIYIYIHSSGKSQGGL